MKYADFYRSIRCRLKEEVDGNEVGYKFAFAHIEDFTFRAIRFLFAQFPEIRMGNRGTPVLQPPATPEPANSEEEIPLPFEFEPALEAKVMCSCHESDANDVKDAQLASYWNKRFQELAGV